MTSYTVRICKPELELVLHMLILPEGVHYDHPSR